MGIEPTPFPTANARVEAQTLSGSSLITQPLFNTFTVIMLL